MKTNTQNIMAFYLMSVLLLKCTVLCAAQGSGYLKLERRINNLEEKVYMDSVEFRVGIESLRLNITSTCSVVEYSKQRSEENVGKEDGKISTKALDNTVKLTLAAEKKYIRNEIRTMKAGVDSAIVRQGLQIADLTTTISKHSENMNARLQMVESSVLTILEKLNVLVKVDSQLMNDFKGLTEKIKEENLDFNERINKIANDISAIGITCTKANDGTQANTKQLETLSKVLHELETLQVLVKNIHFCMKLGGYAFGSSCYSIPEDSKTWSEAVKTCKEKETYLATIESQDENDFLVSLASKLASHMGDYGLWLGASDLAKEGVWIWEENKATLNDIYNNFKPPEPNGGRSENCLHLYRSAGWKWNDTPCGNKMGYICEVSFTNSKNL